MRSCLNSPRFYLFKELTKREIFTRYRGSVLGVWWAFLTPVAMLLVFTFVFGEIFQARWHGGGTLAEFSVKLYAGLIIFWFFSEILTKAPTLIVSNPNYVSKVIFPVEILPLVTVAGSLFHLGINLVVLLIASVAIYGEVFPSLLAAPLVILITVPMLAGTAWLLAALGVYVRDVTTVVGIAMSMLMFLSPIFYPIEAVPEGMRWIFALNPMSLPIEWIRNGACEGSFPSLTPFIVYGTVSIMIGLAGWKLFNAMRKGFCDVL